MSATLPRLLLTAAVTLLAVGCTGTPRVEPQLTADEQTLLAQLTRDIYIDIMSMERDDFDHLVVTTRQGSERVRYIMKPQRPGETELFLHRINDRSVLEVEESDQLGTGPQPGPNGRFR
jgi:hypothetical protein